MREYETTIIVQPEISDEGTAAIFERLEGTLGDSDSLRLQCEDLGKRKLAYEIRKFHKGHYYILSYLSDGQVVPALERVLRLNESILRFMTILVSPDVADIEARKSAGAAADAEQARKAAERVAREEEEAKARAEVERVAAEEAAAAATAAAAAAAATAAAEASAAQEESAASAETASAETATEATPDAQATGDDREGSAAAAAETDKDKKDKKDDAPGAADGDSSAKESA